MVRSAALAQESGTMLPPPRPSGLAPSATIDDSRPTAPDPVGSPSPCVAALKLRHGVDIRVTDRPAGPDGACSVVDPVEVSALSVGEGPGRRRIELRPSAVLSCEMASRVAQWVDTTVGPFAKGHFERDLTALRVGGGHECRNRNRAAAGPLSEHATGRALDIFGFEIGDGPGRISVSVRQPGDHAAFLTAVRQSACGAFATTLGPGSDVAHADHLHVDIKARGSTAGRFCQ